MKEEGNYSIEGQGVMFTAPGNPVILDRDVARDFFEMAMRIVEDEGEVDPILLVVAEEKDGTSDGIVVSIKGLDDSPDMKAALRALRASFTNQDFGPTREALLVMSGCVAESTGKDSEDAWEKILRGDIVFKDALVMVGRDAGNNYQTSVIQAFELSTHGVTWYEPELEHYRRSPLDMENGSVAVRTHGIIDAFFE